MRIQSVTSVTVDEWYGYGHFKEIVVRRANQKLYKFMEGEFPRLHLNDIEDMLFLVDQKKLNNLEGNVIIHLAVGLRITPYTTLSEPQVVIYEDKLKRKRLMRTEELYKFSDGTLASVRNTLDQMLKNLIVRVMSHKSNLVNMYINQNRRDLPRDIPLDRIEVIRYDTKGVKVRKGIMQTEAELTLEQTQQDVSDEVLSDTKVFTVTMEILPEPTSNKLCDSILQAGNPVKDILLKLNLPDHMSVLTDLKIHIKMDMEVPGYSRVKDL
ncbi:hypothetical protein Tco_0621972 [Tanacetum coccineum]